ncbi:MAG: WecB/TagA/CpsF family glycosyltransferase [Phycisphaerales bacterium]
MTIDSRRSWYMDPGGRLPCSAGDGTSSRIYGSGSQEKAYNILGTRFSLLSYRDVMRTVAGWRDDREQHYITLTPPHSVLMCRRDSRLHEATEAASLTLPDGVGIILASKLLGYPHRGRVTGPTLMLRLCDWGREEGLRHYFYGGAPGVAEALAHRLEQRYSGLKVVGTCSPPFREMTPAEDAQTGNRINRAEPDVVWVGLGSPKQEKWMAEHLGRLDVAAMIGVGAAFDFHSGRVKWAPEWIRNVGVEWAYRLATEPKRMWRRNVDSFIFLAGVLHQCAAGVDGVRPSRTRRGKSA